MKNNLLRPVKFAIKHKLVLSGYFTKPSFIIVGAQKAGTTALFTMLTQHPNIVPPLQKEAHFFDGSMIAYPDFPLYHCCFPAPWRMAKDQLTFEASPSYLYHPECAERIYNYSEHMKIVIVLRNPVDRAYSAWNMYRKFSDSKLDREKRISDNRTFEEVVILELGKIENVSWENDRRSYVKRGIYHEQISNYLKYLDKKSIHIIDYKKLRTKHENTMHDLCDFLKINSDYVFQVKNENVSSYRGKMDEGIRNLLNDFYRKHNNRLYDLLGVKFDW